MISRGRGESLGKLSHRLDCLSEPDLDLPDLEVGGLANGGVGFLSKMACKRTITSAADAGRSSRGFASSLSTSGDKSAGAGFMKQRWRILDMPVHHFHQRGGRERVCIGEWRILPMH